MILIIFSIFHYSICAKGRQLNTGRILKNKIDEEEGYITVMITFKCNSFEFTKPDRNRPPQSGQPI